MTEIKTRWCGLSSLIAACLAFACWPMTVVIGFVMAYVAFGLAIASIIAGMVGVGGGIYYRDHLNVLTGTLGIALTIFGVSYVIWAVMHF